MMTFVEEIRQRVKIGMMFRASCRVVRGKRRAKRQHTVVPNFEGLFICLGMVAVVLYRGLHEKERLKLDDG